MILKFIAKKIMSKNSTLKKYINETLSKRRAYQIFKAIANNIHNNI